ncbi:MAG TPA: glycosyltransferase family 39 protein, partial [Verrucomicrobiae bacterium]
MASQQIQDLIHKLEVGAGRRVLQYVMLAVLVLALVFIYDIRAYHCFTDPEAMDAAQVARNLEEGRGFSTDFIRPFSLYLVQKHNLAANPGRALSTNLVDSARVRGTHPDLANPPVYPLLLAGLMKAWTPRWQVELHKPFWSENGHFMRYQPEFRIALFNQTLLLAAVALVFFLAKKLFDGQAAWLAALLVLGSDQLWQFSVSGLSTMLLLVILTGLALCLVKAEEIARGATPKTGGLAALAGGAGMLTGLGMLTRYSFGSLIVPVAAFLLLFGGARRGRLALAAVFSFVLAVSPWLARNLAVSGTLFGTAGYAVTEETFYPGSQLMQSINPNFAIASSALAYAHRFLANISSILQDGLWQLGGGWPGILFLAGLLLGLRNVAARRLRYFAVMCLAALIIAQALGQSAPASSGVNPENLLVLLTPLAAIFGTVFFLTLLDQMKLPSANARYGVIALLVVLACQPLAANVLAKSKPLSYPPYYPPEIQQVGGWLKPGELMMSDMPWAVAWYGQHRCVWLTRNAQPDFYAVNDYLEPVEGLYLT